VETTRLHHATSTLLLVFTLCHGLACTHAPSTAQAGEFVPDAASANDGVANRLFGNCPAVTGVTRVGTPSVAVDALV
jgi:hypothetical protein